MPSPVSMVRGKICSGSLVSSTMLTESSKPTIAKNAIEVAAVTARNMPLALGRLERRDPAEVAAARGERVEPDADHDRERASPRPGVRMTLNFTLSPTPRRLIRASSTMKPMATAMVTPVLGISSIQPLTSSPPKKFGASTLDGRRRAGDARSR